MNGNGKDYCMNGKDYKKENVKIWSMKLIWEMFDEHNSAALWIILICTKRIKISYTTIGNP